jgi:hypothetical protein
LVTLTITHDLGIRTVEDVCRIAAASGRCHVNATTPGRTVVTFATENQARAVAAPLIAASFVSSIEVER